MNTTEDQDCGTSVPERGCLMGVDFGTKRVGLSISDMGQSLATPLKQLQRQGAFHEMRQIQKLAVEYGVRGLVVGLPVHMSGDEGEKAKEAREYGTRLSRELSLPVTYWDERYTSVIAEARLMQSSLSPKKQKERVDKVAATILLQNFLDAPDREAPPPPI